MEDKATSEYTYKLPVEAVVYFTIRIRIHAVLRQSENYCDIPDGM